MHEKFINHFERNIWRGPTGIEFRVNFRLARALHFIHNFQLLNSWEIEIMIRLAEKLKMASRKLDVGRLEKTLACCTSFVLYWWRSIIESMKSNIWTQIGDAKNVLLLTWFFTFFKFFYVFIKLKFAIVSHNTFFKCFTKIENIAFDFGILIILFQNVYRKLNTAKTCLFNNLNVTFVVKNLNYF